VNLFGRRTKDGDGRQPAIPRGGRVYAIGDVHGRYDLLREALARVAADNAARPPADTHVIFLGDLVDRGPDSNAVLTELAEADIDFGELHLLMGNHEESFLSVLQGNYAELEEWLEFGGAETLMSYGIDPQSAWSDPALFTDMIERNVPSSHRALLESMADQIRCGDYLFVHAGIRPGVELAAQSVDDLRWIREPFLSDRRNHELIVVHGHTIVDDVDFRPNRIGIDTGAYRTGKLSILGLEGADRWVIIADGRKGGFPGKRKSGSATAA
jgi:serine/threonine protein phosphatase 1